MGFTKKAAVVALVAISACAGAAASRVVIPPAHAQGMRRWEHSCFHEANEETASKKLGEAGQQGWELVAATPHNYTVFYCMKRPAN